METDDGKRGSIGVVVSLLERPDGSVRLIFDDVKSEQPSPSTWEVTGFFTWQDFASGSFLPSRMSESDLARIGLAIAARLAALAETRDRR